MRPEIAQALSAPGAGPGVQMPASLLERARKKREGKTLRAERAREVGFWAHQALLEVLRHLDSGALLCGYGAPVFPDVPAEQPVEPVSAESPGPTVVVLDYRPTLAGRLQSRLARRMAESPGFLQEIQAQLRKALEVMGYGCHFQTHLVQRHVGWGAERGYHQVVRVQVLVALTQERPVH